jgi:hypothetical protein
VWVPIGCRSPPKLGPYSMPIHTYGENAEKLMRSAEGRTKRTQRPRKWPSGYVVSDVGPCSAAGNGAAGIDTATK